MARRRVIWSVTTPSGDREYFTSRRATRAYAREHGGARAGYRTNEYTHRKALIRERRYLGYIEETGRGRAEGARFISEMFGARERTTADTLLVLQEQAVRRGDARSAGVFERAYLTVEAFATGTIDSFTYEARMRDVFAYAEQQGYTVRHRGKEQEWMYHAV